MLYFTFILGSGLPFHGDAGGMCLFAQVTPTSSWVSCQFLVLYVPRGQGRSILCPSLQFRLDLGSGIGAGMVVQILNTRSGWFPANQNPRQLQADQSEHRLEWTLCIPEPVV